MMHRDALAVTIREIYEDDRISADVAGELLLAIGEVRLHAHPSEAEIDVEEQGNRWMDETGYIWHMTIDAEWTDFKDRIWEWAGGWTWLPDAPDDKQPIMYRTDRPRDETALSRVIAVVGDLRPHLQ